MPDLVSRPFNPDPAMACERCCFGTGEHARFCGGAALDTVVTPFTDNVGVVSYFTTEADPDLPLTEAQLDKWVEQWVEP